jgi:hypothetical protein
MCRIVVFVYIINAPTASCGSDQENRQYAGSHDVHHSAATTAGNVWAPFDPGQRPAWIKA